ncbi:hypothetical protein V2A60_006862 [Cordyceps javanica]
MAFSVVGGAGGGSIQGAFADSLAHGGRGGLVAGSIAVSPGETVVAVAGGAGAFGMGGKSQYGSGGSEPGAGGGGGGASALMTGAAPVLVAVAGGGGGFGLSSDKAANDGNNAERTEWRDGPGHAGQQGSAKVALASGTPVAAAFGGLPGSASGPGEGGTWGSALAPISAVNGSSGIGTDGGPVLSGGSMVPVQAGSGGGGGGGGGYYGAGSGGRISYKYGSKVVELAGDGGGGANFIGSTVLRAAAGISPTQSKGSVTVVFS